jgi:tetratricopeptide (TPR) repeat protein
MVDLADAMPATPERRQLLEEALGILKSISPEPVAALAAVHNALGVYYWDSDDMNRAGSNYLESIALWNRLYPGGHPSSLEAMSNLGAVYSRQGDYRKSADQHSAAIEIQSKVIGAGSVQVAIGLGNLAVAQTYLGDFRGAEANFRQALEIMQKRYGGDHLQVANTIRNLGRILEIEGNYPEAVRQLQASASMFRRLQIDAAGIWNVESQLGVALLRAGRQTEGMTTLRTAVEQLRRLKPEGHYTLADSDIRLGWALLQLRSYKEAEPLFREGLNHRRQHLPAGHPAIAEAECGLAATRKFQNDARAESDLAACLPAFSAWALADPVDIANIRRIARSLVP